jgi:hypothetical protein
VVDCLGRLVKLHGIVLVPTYVSQVPEVVEQTEGALPEVGLFVLYGVGSVKHLPRRLSSHDAHHRADDKLPFVKALRSLSRQQTELLLLRVKKNPQRMMITAYYHSPRHTR